MDPIAQPAKPKGLEHHKSSDVVDSLKNLIKASVTKDKEFREKISQKQEAIKAELGNIVPYKKADEAAKAAIKERTKEKNQYMKRPLLAKMETELRELRREKKENLESQSSYCVEYYRMTQLSLFDAGEGQEIIIKPSARAMIKQVKMSFRKGRH